jgi:glycosyltransferase involved in cell wall biosynthesis
MDDPDVVMVHVTHYNKLMWWTNARVVKVIEHGVPRPEYIYSGEIEKGIVVINNLHQRGRLLGADIFEEVSRRVPLELIGMGTAEHGGSGEVLHPRLPEYVRRFRFFFNPIRYTSMGLAVCEAMLLGMPVVALSTTEYPEVLQNEVTGFVSNDIGYLIYQMQRLLADRKLSAALGRGARRVAEERFDIHRFTRQWEDTFWSAIHHNMSEHETNSIYQ